MKKHFLITILLILNISIFAQDIKVNNILPFKTGVDAAVNVYSKLSGYCVCINTETIDDVILTEICVDEYLYNDMVGILEIYIANDKLYYIRFTSNDKSIISYSNKLFNKYKVYWNE